MGNFITVSSQSRAEGQAKLDALLGRNNSQQLDALLGGRGNNQMVVNGGRQELTTRQTQLSRLYSSFTLPPEEVEEEELTPVQQFTEIIRLALVKFGIDCQFEMYVGHDDQTSFGYKTRITGLDDRQMIALQYVREQIARDLSKGVSVGFDMVGRFVRIIVWVKN